jgi:hypothetical protein
MKRFPLGEASMVARARESPFSAELVDQGRRIVEVGRVASLRTQVSSAVFRIGLGPAEGLPPPGGTHP